MNWDQWSEYEDDELLHELKRMQDNAYNNSNVTRERGSDDLVFYYVTQWDDTLLDSSDLSYRGEFNILKKAGKDIMSDLADSPVQVDFAPIDETPIESADVVDGMYRTDARNNQAVESFNNAKKEAVVCGVGAWELYTEYETSRMGDSKQVIKRQPLHEANNNVFWDPNSKLMDKSDANYVSILTPYSKESYKKL